MKTIDLTKPFTMGDVRELLVEQDDAQTTQLRVRADGVAYIHRGSPGDDLEGLAFRLETWYAGSGYVGAIAARDDEWVGRIYRALKENWPYPRSRYIDIY